jgi:hypothetical protein
MAFYTENFSSDSQRVNQKFRDAAKNNVAIEKRSVPIEEIKEHVLSGNSVVALIDASMLFCKDCTLFYHESDDDGPTSTYLGNQTLELLTFTTGHYIFVYKYEEKTKQFYYNDPNKRKGACRMTESVFEKCRKSFGTDEDLLLIYHQ